jgi:hypothetical protein
MLLTDSSLRLSIKCYSCNTFYITGYKIVLEQRIMHSDKIRNGDKTIYCIEVFKHLCSCFLQSRN